MSAAREGTDSPRQRLGDIQPLEVQRGCGTAFTPPLGAGRSQGVQATLSYPHSLPAQGPGATASSVSCARPWPWWDTGLRQHLASIPGSWREPPDEPWPWPHSLALPTVHRGQRVRAGPCMDQGHLGSWLLPQELHPGVPPVNTKEEEAEIRFRA